MPYPTTASAFKTRYPGYKTYLQTPLQEARDPASSWTYAHAADLGALQCKVRIRAPEQLNNYLDAVQRQFGENQQLCREIRAFANGAELCIPIDKFCHLTPALASPYGMLSLAIQNAPSLTIDDRRQLSTRYRAPVAREGYVHDMSGIYFGSSDPISSEQEIPEDSFELRTDQSGKQELPVQLYTLSWLIHVDALLNAGLPNANLERPQFTTVSRRFVVDSPGAQLKAEVRDDCGAVWRGPDLNGRMATLYLPSVLSIEAKSGIKDCFPQWVAELVGQFTETAAFAKMDYDDPESIEQLTEDQRTKFVLSVQGLHFQWVWAIFSVPWIMAFLGPKSKLVSRSRIVGGSPEHEHEPELPGPGQKQGSDSESEDDDAMSGIEVEEDEFPFLKVYCSETQLFTEPPARFNTLTSAQACLKFSIDHRVHLGQAMVNPPQVTP